MDRLRGLLGCRVGVAGGRDLAGRERGSLRVGGYDHDGGSEGRPDDQVPVPACTSVPKRNHGGRPVRTRGIESSNETLTTST